MTDMLQKSENVANKNSQDLTEKWKKGELKLGHYYYTTIFSPTVYIQNFTRDVISFQDFKETVAEVLAPVPSYEEWQAKLEENAQLKERISKLEKMQYSYTPEEWNTMLRTVNRTKELLKRAKIILEDEGDYMIVQEIDEALR